MEFAINGYHASYRDNIKVNFLRKIQECTDVGANKSTFCTDLFISFINPEREKEVDFCENSYSGNNPIPLLKSLDKNGNLLEKS